MMLRRLLPAILAAVCAAALPLPASAAPAPVPVTSLAQAVGAELAKAPAGTRFGVLVVDSAGSEVYALNPDQRFSPASNTKLYTTIAAYALLPALDLPDVGGGAGVALEPHGEDAPDAVLVGHGDARLSSAADCVTDCLATLADAIAARTRHLRNVVGDDSALPEARWSAGMGWNNIQSEDGTATSALSLDDNALALVVSPTAPGQPPQVQLSAYYTVRNEAVTGAAGSSATLFASRAPGSRELRIAGAIPAGGKVHREALGIDDPAHYAAWRLAQLLAARGVQIGGAVIARHRAAQPADDPALRGATPVIRPAEQAVIARLTPPPLAEDVVVINKHSQNLHAELLLRRIGLLGGSGSVRDGLAVLRSVIARAGIAPTATDFADGSGMSAYNRVSPRASVQLLRWAAGQPWGARWRESLPVGGVDGTLHRRFAGTPLAGKIRAKTGTLYGTNALAGYLTAASGRELTFAIYANDVPGDVSSAPMLDAALLRIAARN